VVSRVERRGMKKSLNSEQRAAIWAAGESMAAEMEAMRTYSKNYSRIKIIRYAQAHPGDEKPARVDYIFVDEAQDLSAADLKALKACARVCVVMAGDSDQSIYQPGFTFRRAGIDIQGRTRILKTNFRNTVQLQEVAEKYRATMPGWDAENQPQAFRAGPPPELYTASTAKDLLDLLLKRFDVFLRYLEYDPENLAVLVPTNDDIGVVREALKAKGIMAADIKDANFDFTQAGVVRLSTMHSSKGLDFPVVFLYLPKMPYFGGAYDSDAAERMTRNLIYVSITRAMDHLNVFCSDNTTNRAIADLMDCFKVEV